MLTPSPRHITSRAIDYDGHLIPIWEFDYEYREYDNYSTHIYTHPEHGVFGTESVIECLYDLREKEMCRYTLITSMLTPKHSVGDRVLCSLGAQQLVSRTIVDVAIGSQECEEVVDRASALNLLNYYPNMTFADGKVVTSDSLVDGACYTHCRHRCKYVFDDGSSTEWNHDIYTLV